MVVIIGFREFCIVWIIERKCGVVVFIFFFIIDVCFVVCF